MHYKITNLTIQSEYAAKSYKQKSRDVLSWFEKQAKVKRGLDYGCGKLRYSKELANICNETFLLDSIYQLERVQTLFDEKTTIPKYVEKNIPNAIIYSNKNISEIKVKIDLILCINVLSTIPTSHGRNQVIKNVFSLLSKNGKALFVTQYYDSYFEKALNNPDNIKYNDGWISKRNYNSFYGLISPQNLEKLLINNKMKIHKKWIVSKSVYIEAGI